MSEKKGVRVKVGGDYACFTRPEFKAERVTYPVMTPSAALGVLEAIYWKPEFLWEVREIQVLRDIHETSILRNEIDSTQSKQGGPFFIEDKRIQRSCLMLRDVEYIIHAEIVQKPHDKEHPEKHINCFTRRVEKGQCHQENEEDDEQDSNRFAPPVDLQQLDELLKSPWTGKETKEELPENTFQLAILSANTGRLVMRDWISVSISQLRQNLIRFYDALKIISPWGDTNRVFPIPAIVKALRSEPRADASDPMEGVLFKKRRNVDSRHSDLVRSFVRSAYLGHRPDPGILTGAVQRFRNPKTLGSHAEIHVLAGTIKLILTYNRKEAETMQALDHTRNVRAYLCGQILAILEEAQRRAASNPLNTTLVDRAYGAASMSPKSMLPALIRTLEMGHLPKIRKKWKAGYDELRESLEGIGKKLDEAGGYPVTLSLQDQAEFALGFYCQRAEFRKPKQN